MTAVTVRAAWTRWRKASKFPTWKTHIAIGCVPSSIQQVLFAANPQTDCMAWRLCWGARGLSVFDVGCHDGTVLAAFGEAGAASLAGIDVHAPSLAIATARLPQAQIHAHDLMVGPSSHLTAGGADIVLYLGVHHHLLDQGADATGVAAWAIAGARRFFAARAPLAALAGISELAMESGLSLWSEDASSGVVSPLRIFARETTDD